MLSESLTYREKQALAHVSLAEVNINKTNQTQPVMTAPPLKIISAVHLGRRSIFSADTVHPRVMLKRNCFQLNPILNWYYNFLTAGKATELHFCSAQMRHLALLLWIKSEKNMADVASHQMQL